MFERKRRRTMEFLDIGEHCMREVCDRMNLVTLAAIGGTCHQLLDIARKSFIARKVSKIIYKSIDFSEHAFRTEKAFDLLAILRTFGHSITDIAVHHTLQGYSATEQTNIFNEMLRQCSGTLSSLKYEDYFGRQNSKQMLDATHLMENLTELELNIRGPSYTNFPLVACQELAILKIHLWNSNQSHAFFNNTFPKLSSLMVSSIFCKCIDQSEFDNFIRRHPQLTELTVDEDDINYSVLSESPILETITILKGGERILPLGELKQLKAIRLQSLYDQNKVIELINSLATHDQIQELYLPNLNKDVTTAWEHLAKLKSLRMLELGAFIADTIWANKSENLLRQLPLIKKFKIYRYRKSKFEMHAFNCLDAICQQRDIALDVVVEKFYIDQKDLPKFSQSGNLSGWSSIRFGRHN